MLAVRTGAPVPIDWDDDRVLATAYQVLRETDRAGGRARGGGPQMSG